MGRVETKMAPMSPKHPLKRTLHEIYQYLKLALIGCPDRNRKHIEEAMKLISKLEHRRGYCRY